MDALVGDESPAGVDAKKALDDPLKAAKDAASGFLNGTSGEQSEKKEEDKKADPLSGLKDQLKGR